MKRAYRRPSSAICFARSPSGLLPIVVAAWRSAAGALTKSLCGVGSTSTTEILTDIRITEISYCSVRTNCKPSTEIALSQFARAAGPGLVDSNPDLASPSDELSPDEPSAGHSQLPVSGTICIYRLAFENNTNRSTLPVGKSSHVTAAAARRIRTFHHTILCEAAQDVVRDAGETAAAAPMVQ